MLLLASSSANSALELASTTTAYWVYHKPANGFGSSNVSQSHYTAHEFDMYNPCPGNCFLNVVIAFRACIPLPPKTLEYT